MKYVSGGYKYRLAQDEIFFTSIIPYTDIETEFLELLITGRLVVKKGYAWDGASGPTVDTKSSMRGSLCHDALYQLMREGYIDKTYRETVDKLFYKLIREDGMNIVRAYLWFRAVRRFAGFAVKNKEQILTAP